MKRTLSFLLIASGIALAETLPGKTSKPQPLAAPDFGLRLLPIPAGEFRMGTDDAAPIVKPYLGARKARLSQAFHLSETEVTQQTWQKLMGSNPSSAKGPNLPVEQVTWKQAQAFCRKLTERERAAGRLPKGKVYRLPTEAEWEYAALAGKSAVYFFGNDPALLPRYAWFNENADGKTHPVGKKLPNPWGLRDMYGNVREWCLDGYSPRPSGPAPLVDPIHGPHNPDKVNRGGSYDSCAPCCKTHARTNYGPGYQSPDLGFRIALAAPLEASAP